jgi:hypothetical protein
VRSPRPGRSPWRFFASRFRGKALCGTASATRRSPPRSLQRRADHGGGRLPPPSQSVALAAPMALRGSKLPPGLMGIQMGRRPTGQLQPAQGQTPSGPTILQGGQQPDSRLSSLGLQTTARPDGSLSRRHPGVKEALGRRSPCRGGQQFQAVVLFSPRVVKASRQAVLLSLNVRLPPTSRGSFRGCPLTQCRLRCGQAHQSRRDVRCWRRHGEAFVHLPLGHLHPRPTESAPLQYPLCRHRLRHEGALYEDFQKPRMLDLDHPATRPEPFRSLAEGSPRCRQEGLAQSRSWSFDTLHSAVSWPGWREGGS